MQFPHRLTPLAPPLQQGCDRTDRIGAAGQLAAAHPSASHQGIDVAGQTIGQQQNIRAEALGMAPGEASACGGGRAGHGGGAVGLGWGGKGWRSGGRQGLWARDAHPVGTVLRSGGWDTFMQGDPGRGLRCSCPWRRHPWSNARLLGTTTVLGLTWPASPWAAAMTDLGSCRNIKLPILCSILQN